MGRTRSRSAIAARVALIGVSSLALMLAVGPVVSPHGPHPAFAATVDGSLVLLGIGFVSAGALLRRRTE
jgi:hypothetical protein